MAFFEGKKMTGGYGGPDIITSCTVDVNKGEIVAILGPNGAGKSTAMKAMLGLLNLKSGTVTIDGKDISKLSPQDRVKQGISFVPQTRNVFTGLSVQENLEMGAYLREERFEEIIEEIYNKIDIDKLAMGDYDEIRKFERHFHVLYLHPNTPGGKLIGKLQPQIIRVYNSKFGTTIEFNRKCQETLYPTYS